MIVAFVGAALSAISFWVGCWWGRREGAEVEATLRADLAMWRRFSEELHEENCNLRKAGL